MAKASIKLAEKVKLSEEETVRAKWAVTERKDRVITCPYPRVRITVRGALNDVFNR
ncbi:MAG: hypothetical protein QXK12_05810 [Candidatus Nezhaarchaeales archaeon]